MKARFLPHILTLCALPALIGCGSDAPPPAAPLSEKALAAVAEKPGVGREKLARAIDNLFADAESGETRALIVMHQGRRVVERYGPSYHENTRFAGWSMSKTITAVLTGLLVADGRLRLDEGVPVPAWQRTGDPRGEITLRQLLQMRSGLRHTEGSDPPYESGEVRMLFLDGRDNMAAHAEAQPLEAEPGRKFEYSSATTVVLSDVAAHALTDSRDPSVRRTAVRDYLRTRLFEPLAMQSMLAEFDAAGTLIGSSLIHANARDWARFGEFLRYGGSVRGAQLVPRGWVDFMTTSSPRNKGYGGQLWLNREGSQKEDLVMFPGHPANVFAARGHLGQLVVVSPDQKLTVVRLGHSNEAQQAVMRRRLGEVMALFPEG